MLVNLLARFGGEGAEDWPLESLMPQDENVILAVDESGWRAKYSLLMGEARTTQERMNHEESLTEIDPPDVSRNDRSRLPRPADCHLGGRGETEENAPTDTEFESN